MIRYEKKAPSRGLANYVQCLWSMKFEEGDQPLIPTTQILLPDGCTELVIELVHSSNGRGSQDRINVESFFVGHLRKATQFVIENNKAMVGVRFTAIGSQLFLPHVGSELIGKVLSLPDVAGDDAKVVAGKIFDERDVNKHFEILESFLISRLKAVKCSADSFFAVISALRSCPDLCDSVKIANRLGVSRRQAERLFQDFIGVPPRELARIWRIQKVVELRASHPSASLSLIGEAAGYYDSAHFVNDFKKISGLTPGRYFSGIHKMTEHFRRESEMSQPYNDLFS